MSFSLPPSRSQTYDLVVCVCVCVCAREREREKEREREREREMWETKREPEKKRDVGDRELERINKLIKYYTILLQCALKNESAL